MPTAPSTSNYKVGGARVYLGGLDLGNIKALEVDPTQVTVLQHFTARSGSRKVDKQTVTQKRLFFRVTLDEHAADLYRKYFMAGNTGLNVDALTQPLVETNCVVEWREEAAVIWSFSHTRVTARPAAAMGFGEFNDWVDYQLEIEVLQDDAAVGREQGRFVFTA